MRGWHCSHHAEEMPQISEACPDLLSAVYWHANTSGLYVIAGHHAATKLSPYIPMVFLSRAIKSQWNILKVFLYLVIIWRIIFKGRSWYHFENVLIRMVIIEEKNTPRLITLADSFRRALKKNTNNKLNKPLQALMFLLADADLCSLKSSPPSRLWRNLTWCLCHITAITVAYTRGATRFT